MPVKDKEICTFNDAMYAKASLNELCIKLVSKMKYH